MIQDLEGRICALGLQEERGLDQQGVEAIQLDLKQIRQTLGQLL